MAKYKLKVAKDKGIKLKECVLEENKICNDCKECLKCDLDPTKICDNCGKCLGDRDYSTIFIDEIIMDEKS